MPETVDNGRWGCSPVRGSGGGCRLNEEGGTADAQELPKIETPEQAREVLLGMDEQQEITAESGEWRASIKKHNDQEFSATFVEHETGIISLRDASHILLEYGSHDLYLG